jgi:predicted flap endonuclease-1-like 5' DNA nuclease
MNGWFMLVLGLLLGFIVEWIVDWRFWRRQDGGDSSLRDKLSIAESNVRDLELRLKEALNREPERIVETIIKEVPIVATKDRLQDIKGIGNVFAGRLNDAGINTFADLATTPPERLQAIINPEEWQAIETEAWVVQAKEFNSKNQAQAV